MADGSGNGQPIEENELVTDVHQQSTEEKTFGESQYLVSCLRRVLHPISLALSNAE